jgi:hypothetical protein
MPRCTSSKADLKSRGATLMRDSNHNGHVEMNGPLARF